MNRIKSTNDLISDTLDLIESISDKKDKKELIQAILGTLDIQKRLLDSELSELEKRIKEDEE
jgi:hypothetical protein